MTFPRNPYKPMVQYISNPYALILKAATTHVSMKYEQRSLLRGQCSRRRVLPSLGKRKSSFLHRGYRIYTAVKGLEKDHGNYSNRLEITRILRA